MRRRQKKRITALIYTILIAAAALCIALICSELMRGSKDDGGVASTMADASDSLSEIQTQEASSAAQEENQILIADFPHISQNVKYPTGCESVAAVSLMQFYNVDITVEEFIDMHLPTAGYPYYEDNVMYGESPWDAFIGDPYSESGYGCYSTVIVKAMKSALPQGYGIQALYNVPLPQLCSEYIDKGQPVLIWATMDMREPYEGNSWLLPNGESFTFICPEHALVLIGYDDTSYYFCNPQADEAVVSYPRADCETAYNALHSQAVVMQPLT